KLNHIEPDGVYGARNVARALIREYPHAPNVWRNLPQDREGALWSERSRTSGENHTDVRCAERDRVLRVLGSRQTAELDVNGHGRSSELPSIPQRLPGPHPV